VPSPGFYISVKGISIYSPFASSSPAIIASAPASKAPEMT
jgi:hypothetical protein